MPRFRPLAAVLTGLVLTCLPALPATAAPDWTKVKTGMNDDEALKHLGEPLIRTRGRGFEVWIYDGQGEALFAGGPLKSWTAAKPSAESLARPVAQDVLIRAVRRTRLAPTQALQVRTYSDESASRFRYRQQ